MKDSKGKLIAYWIITVLVAANYLFAGVSYISRNEQVQGMSKVLGYPIYFIVMLGVWKILGGLAILAPKTPVIKEWAYAGMLINLVGASVSCGVMGLGLSGVLFPVIMLVFVIASWALRPASRRPEKMF